MGTQPSQHGRHANRESYLTEAVCRKSCRTGDEVNHIVRHPHKRAESFS